MLGGVHTQGAWISLGKAPPSHPDPEVTNAHILVVVVVGACYCLFETGSYYVAQAGLELAILLPLLPRSWDFRLASLDLMSEALHAPLCLTPANPQGLLLL